jgi:PIN domain nuclease of toxin-antitoxin system
MTSYLLDTCTFIWMCAEPDRLSSVAKSAIDGLNASIVFSDVTALEISLKWSSGKIDLPDPPRHWIESQIAAWSLDFRAISREDIYLSGELPDHHRDPFDRLLIAAAMNSNSTILTPDQAIKAYPVSCRW